MSPAMRAYFDARQVAEDAYTAALLAGEGIGESWYDLQQTRTWAWKALTPEEQDEAARLDCQRIRGLVAQAQLPQTTTADPADQVPLPTWELLPDEVVSNVDTTYLGQWRCRASRWLLWHDGRQERGVEDTGVFRMGRPRWRRGRAP